MEDDLPSRGSFGNHKSQETTREPQARLSNLHQRACIQALYPDRCRLSCKLKVESVGRGGRLSAQMSIGPSTMTKPFSRSSLHRISLRTVWIRRKANTTIVWKDIMPATMRSVQMTGQSMVDGRSSTVEGSDGMFDVATFSIYSRPLMNAFQTRKYKASVSIYVGCGCCMRGIAYAATNAHAFVVLTQKQTKMPTTNAVSSYTCFLANVFEALTTCDTLCLNLRNTLLLVSFYLSLVF